MARWELVPDGTGFVLLRDGDRIVGLGGPSEWAEEELHRYREQEGKAREALATGDPLDVCRIGWHRGALPAAVGKHIGALASYFRFGAEISEAGGTLVYRVAEEPFEFLARTVKCLGNLDPWTCADCDQAIPTDDLRPELEE